MVQPVGSQIYGAFLQGQDEKRRQDAQGIRTLAGALGIRGALMEQQLAPLRQQLLQAQIQKAMAPSVPRPQVVGPGAALVGSDGVIHSQPFKSPEILDPRVQDAKIRIAQAGRPNVDVRVDAAGNAFAKTVGGESGKRMIAEQDTANLARENVDKLNRVLQHIDQSDAITGLGADVLKNVERAKALVLQSEKAGKKVSDTELLDSFLGSDVFPMIKQLGIGARGLDTPAEREFLRQVMTGTIQMNKETLRKMTEIRRDIAVRAIEKWDKKVDSGELDSYFKFSMQPKRKIGVPELFKSEKNPLTAEEQDELARLRAKHGKRP